MWRRKFSWERQFRANPRASKNSRIREKAQRCRVGTRYIKKSNRHFFQERSMKYCFIKKNEKIFPIEKMCRVLEISTGSFYRWRRASVTIAQQRVIALKEQVKNVYFESKQRYGSPRIAIELQNLGYQISRGTVAKYMKALGLKSKLSKKFKITTNSNHNYLTVDNVLNREFIVSKPSKAWVSDITYIQTKEGFLYLTTIMDLYDRKIIDWSLSDGMSTEQTSLRTWKMAVKIKILNKD
ncbi:IS3 family transposase [Flavobacterium acetivorans]|nr:IS3 family transposase [Flavobacterium sp. F-29]UFH36968.1 IS3 family transposase [Flavobacterium sp. F-29]